MKNEREMFEEWYFNNHYAGTTACWLKVFSKFENLKGSEKSYNGKYINDRVLLAYEAWQASAQREGYKLVPVDKLEELKRDADRMISSAHLYQDECHIKSFGRSFLHNYKAMMGAGDE